jgi:hypothetical protein
MSLMLKNDARSLAMRVTLWLSFKNLPSQQMVVHLFFALTVSIRWRLLFPTFCWSIDTMVLTIFDFWLTNFFEYTAFPANKRYVILHLGCFETTGIHTSSSGGTCDYAACIKVSWGALEQDFPDPQ